MSHADALEGGLITRRYRRPTQTPDPAQAAPQGADGHHRHQHPPTVLFDALSLSAWTPVAEPLPMAGEIGTLWYLSPADRERLLMAHAAGRVLIARQRVDGELLVVAKFARHSGRRR